MAINYKYIELIPLEMTLNDESLSNNFDLSKKGPGRDFNGS